MKLTALEGILFQMRKKNIFKEGDHSPVLEKLIIIQTPCYCTHRLQDTDGF